MHRHLEAGAVEPPDVNKIAGSARQQVADAELHQRCLVEHEQPREQVLAHLVAHASGDVAGEHAQEVAEQGQCTRQPEQPTGVQRQHRRSHACQQFVHCPTQERGAESAGSGSDQRVERSEQQRATVWPHIRKEKA